MECADEKVLYKVLDVDEVETIQLDVRKKLEKFCTNFYGEFFAEKAERISAQKNIENVRKEAETQITTLSTRLQDTEAKFDISQQNIAELRSQLDSSRQEVMKLQENVSRYETEVFDCRREKNAACEERDSLLKQVERRNMEVERLQSDIMTLEKQLQAASRTKCEALAKVHEIESKEVTLDFKEKLMEQDRQILNHQIQSLTDDLSRTVAELQNIRRDHTLTKIQLETQVAEKTEELRITRGSIGHLEETNASLQTKAEELTSKLHAQNEETAKILNHYKKELQSKSKLVDMMKEAKQENEQQTHEMSTCITELKKLLNESAERYGELETKLKGIDVEHGKDLDEKDVEIKKLMDELEHANDLLKEAQEASLEHAVEQLAPTAAASSRLIKSGMTLTEIYSLYVKSSEELQVLKKENSQLNLRIRSIIEEIEERAPMIRKQALDNQKLEEANTELTNQLEAFIKERIEAKEEYDNMSVKLGHMEREYKKLKMSQSDLGIQVCYLVKEIEQMRGGFSSDHDQSICSDMSASEVISKKLVTFGNIQELQENNQKLLHVVRDLSAKLEEIEDIEAQKSTASFEAKLASYTKKIEEMQHSQDCQTQMMAICMQQRDRYKKLYSDLSKSLTNTYGVNKSLNLEGSFNGDPMEEDDNPLANSSTNVSSEALAGKEKKITELEEKLKESQTQIKTLKEEYDSYRKEKFTNEKMVNEHFDTMRNEIRDLTSTNCKLMSTVANNNEQIKLQQKNAVTLKKQIETLEEKTKFFEKIIVKHEQTEMILKDEVMKVQSDLARAEVQLENLKQENRIIKDSEARMKAEHESLHRERLNQNLLMNNLEMIKASFERSETEGKIRLEERLDQTNRECSALRRRLQEEQDHFRLLSADLERQTETARKRMEEEISQVDKIRDELRLAREEIVSKTKQIEDLSMKLQESLTPNKSDNPIAQANKKVKELEIKTSEYVIEIENLQKELISAKEHVQQYCKLSESAEAELRELNTVYTDYKTKMDAELEKTKLSEETLKAKVEDLETEISLQITKERINDGDSASQLTRTQTELRDALQKLSDVNKELRDSREQIRNLTTNLQAVEQKYSNEMAAHLNDLESMSSNKEELNQLREATSKLREERDRATDSLKTVKYDWETREKLLQGEVEQLEARMKDHEQQNAALLDQIQALSMKLSVVSAGMEINQSQNESQLDSSLMNRSITEDDIKSSDQLLQIIKYLRKEKDIAFAKVDVLKSETTRLQTEQGILLKKLEETQEALNSERSKPEAGIISASKHEEILRKVETLNAIADSNRILRDERDALQAKVKDLSDKVTKIEDELFPIQEKNRELLQKQEETATENVSLRIEATKWRQRANMLVERTNKTNPEDFKRLQAEKESLTKMLAGEKENLKKITEELNQIRIEKNKQDTDLANLLRQVSNSTEENKKIQEDVQGLRVNNQKLSNELMEIKNSLLTKEEELKKIAEDLSNKDAQMNDAKNKEVQIRKIAKKYKDAYIELKNKVDGKEEGEKQDAQQGPSNLDLTVQLSTAQEENEALKRENEILKSSKEADERSKLLLKEANSKIAALQESKNTITKELVVTKTQLQTIEQNREERASGYESRISRLEKELLDEKENKDTIARLIRENETLNHRVNQLQRQLGIQQVAKPSTSASTSEKASSESPRTANVKPMASPSHQSATVTPWRGGETPLASIRPMSVQNRTAAVIPTSQTPPTNLLAIQGTSSSTSSSSVTALVPPQQQVHTTGNASAEVMSSSPTSSHTDYMPTTSSATVAVVATVPPMGASNTSSTTAESTQQDNESSGAQSQSLAQPQEGGLSAQVVLPTAHQSSSQSPQQAQVQHIAQGQQQQAVALVSPRVETAAASISQQSPQLVVADQNQVAAPSTSAAALQPVTTSHYHLASSSNTVTTSQAGVKRPRDVEGDSPSSIQEQQPDKSQPQSKRTRIIGEAFQGVSESCLDVEYQVPTSSQREPEFDIIVVDSEEDEEEDNGMADEGTAEADDGPFEDEADNGESYEMEGYEQEQEIANYDDGEGPDIDEDNNLQSDTNEVEVDDSNEIPNQSGNNSNSGAEAGPSGRGNQSRSSSSDQAVDMSTQHQNQSEIQQIQTISSGSGGNEAGSSTSSTAVATPSSQTVWRQMNTPHSRQQAAHLVLIQPGYEETGDDCIVPSTPNLFAPRRADGFNEVISSPHPQVPHASRFTFSESAPATRSSTSLVPGGNLEGIEDTQIDLSQMNETGRTVPNTPKLVTSPLEVDAGSSTATTAQQTGGDQPQQQEPQDLVVHQTSQEAQNSSQEPLPGTSQAGQSEMIPEITVTGAGDDDEDLDDDDEPESDTVEQNATTSQQSNSGDKSNPPGSDAEEGTDGVTSEGEKPPGTEGVEIDEGREAEASTPSINTRSRSLSNQSPPANRRGQGRGMRGRTPIVWGDNQRGNHGGMMNTRMQQHPQFQQQQHHQPQQMMNQRGQRGRRMRRPSGNLRF